MREPAFEQRLVRRETELLSLHEARADVQRRIAALEARIALTEERISDRGRQPAIDWGDLGLDPLSEDWGADRGRCVDRVYIEAFLLQHVRDIRGHVLEIHDDDYTRRFGGDGVERSDVLDIDPTNPRATLVADLRHAPELATAAFDCIILTQTLQCIDAPERALGECVRLLKPGGVILATLPCVSRLAPEAGPDGDFWRFTPEGARQLFVAHVPAATVHVSAWGNAAAIVAFLHGLAAHELEPFDWQKHDPRLPLLLSVRAQKPGVGP